MSIRRVLATAIGVMALCGAQPGSAGAQGGQPLAPWTGARVAVFPAQLVRTDAAWASGVDGRASLRALDDSLAAALADAGVSWIPASELTRAARRNPTYATDPANLLAQPLRRLRTNDEVPETVAGRLRTILAFTDARFALVPVELQLPGVDREDTGRATLLLQMVDARAQKVLWAGLVRAEPDGQFSDAALGVIVSKIVALLGAP